MWVRAFAEQDYPAFVEVRNRAYGNKWLTVEAARHLVVRTTTGGFLLRRFVAEDADDHIVGIGQLYGDGLRGHYRMELGVEPRLWRRGIGSLLWQTLLAELSTLDARVVQVRIDPAKHESLSFLEHRGFVETQRVFGSALDIATFDPAPFAELERCLAERSITFTTLADELAHDVELLRKIHGLHNRCREDQPGDEGGTISFAMWMGDTIDGPFALPDACFLAREGQKYVGLSILDRRDGGVVGAIHQGFTGVLPSHRGRGIAKALKLRAIAYAREHGYREIRTDNSSLNAPMLRVNETLGFRRCSETVFFERAL